MNPLDDARTLDLRRMVSFAYKNHRGERFERYAYPLRIRFGTNEWHADPCWIMEALDLSKLELRSFATRDMLHVREGAHGAPLWFRGSNDTRYLLLRALCWDDVLDLFTCKHLDLLDTDRRRATTLALLRAQVTVRRIQRLGGLDALPVLEGTTPP